MSVSLFSQQPAIKLGHMPVLCKKEKMDVRIQGALFILCYKICPPYCYNRTCSLYGDVFCKVDLHLGVAKQVLAFHEAKVRFLGFQVPLCCH